jgi:hypothetical protein
VCVQVWVGGRVSGTQRLNTRITTNHDIGFFLNFWGPYQRMGVESGYSADVRTGYVSSMIY